jgi:DNA helicase-2/ATP-dependent DNA helicase PcrA
VPQITEITLNKEQEEAVQYNSGHLLVLAGAGSGKTRVLTSKIVRIIDSGIARPWQILAMTFTNKAAGEMRERIHRQLGTDGENQRVKMGTFHSICVWILRREARTLGFSENFSIYDGDDQKTLVRRMIKSTAAPLKITSGAAKGFISLCKNDLISVEEALSSASSPYHESMALVYQAYQEELKKSSAFDFDDLLTQVLLAMRHNSDIRNYYRRIFTRILVDEYQDTNKVQNEILKEITGENTAVTVVGDDDQSIYGWRGARVENILKFPDEFAGAKTVRLETNYRSTGNILLAASSLVKHNRNRHGKTLRPMLDSGEKVQIMQVLTPEEEAHYILSCARDINTDGTPWNEIAVLFRTNAQSGPLETMSRRMRIPYEVVGTVRFFERAEIKDVVAYLRVIINPLDAESFRRVINKPARALGDKGQQSFFQWAEENRTDVVTTLEKSGSIDGIAKRAKNILETLGRNLRSCMDGVNDGDTASEIVDRVLDFTGLLVLYGSGEVADETRLQNISEFRRYAAEYDSRNPEGGLSGFLGEQSLLSSSDTYSGDEKLILMTLHSAKGLEFDCVFVSGLEEGVLPFIRAQEYSPRDVEEERRLLYVGMTRARKKLILTWCSNRPRPGGFPIGPSRFLSEIADDDRPDTALPGIKEKRAGLSSSEASATSAASYSRGNLVKHPRYGKGIVVSAKRRGSEWELQINFGFDEPKTLLTGYVPIPVLKEKAEQSDLE